MEEILLQLIGNSSNYLQGFIHVKRWCRISSINSIIRTLEILEWHKCTFNKKHDIFIVQHISLSILVFGKCIQHPAGVLTSWRRINAAASWKLQHVRWLEGLHKSDVVPSRELTYPPKNGVFEDDFPFPQVGYVIYFPGG